MLVSRKKNRSIPFGDRAEDERANSRTLHRRGRVYRKKTKNKKRANIVHIYGVCACRISGRRGVRGSCADVILIDPRFLPLIAHYPRCKGISHVLTEAYTYIYYTAICIRLYGEHEWNYALYIIHVYIYIICITYYIRITTLITHSCVLLYLRSFRARVLLHDNDTYKGTFMLMIYICTIHTALQNWIHTDGNNIYVVRLYICVCGARGNRWRLARIIVILMIYTTLSWYMWDNLNF